MPPNRNAEILEHVLSSGARGDPDAVLAAMDSYGYTRAFHMSVGDVKGRIIDDIVREHAPQVMVEIGGYLGYSAVRFSRLLKPGARYYSFEVDRQHASIAREIIEFAGLAERCTVIVGAFDQLAKESLLDTMGTGCVDMFFIDHWKDVYVRDLQFIERGGYCRPGAVVVADNCITPGCPEYLTYVQVSPFVESTRLIETVLEYHNDVKDGISVSIMK
ncbi:hypothetical protein HDU83_007595 [Entophlyctis luteolus]|nr:hypothetical protein HDU83_007595 [Entophlyctis luteolus]KAJ3378773.1 hypothetical protein HDU84_007317 [Entophlyctis sp. JEL0112]